MLRIRYIAPIIPPLVILSVFGAKNIIDSINSFGLKLFIALSILLVPLGYNVQYLATQFAEVNPLSYLTGDLTRDQYITKHRFEYPAMQYINKNLPEDSRILFVFLGKRGYYCDREYIFDMNNSKSTIERLVKKANNVNEIYQGIRKSGVTHLLIYHCIFEKWKNDRFSIEEKELLNGFLYKYVEMVYYDKGFSVSERFVVVTDLQ